MQVFTIKVLPSHLAQMPVLAKNVTVQCGEDCPRHNGPRVLTIPKEEGGQVRIIACPHSCRPLCGIHLRKSFLISATAAAVAATAAVFGGTFAH